jgi:hypothetical protein
MGLLASNKVSQVRLNRIAKFQADKLKEFNEVWRYKPCDRAEFDKRYINSIQTLLGVLYQTQTSEDIEILICQLAGLTNAYNQFVNNKF